MCSGNAATRVYGDFQKTDVLERDAGLGEERAADREPGVAGRDLIDPHRAEEITRDKNNYGRINEVDATLEAFFEVTFAAPAGVDLGFDDEFGTAEFPGRRRGFFRGGGDPAGGAGDVEAIKEFLGLVFVDVHGRS